MEDFGLILYTLVALGISTILCLLTLVFRPLRRFALAVFSMLPAAAVLFFITRWAVIDNSPVCGPNPEWDRCPTASLNVAGWIGWGIGVIAVPVAAYWLQRAVVAALGL